MGPFGWRVSIVFQHCSDIVNTFHWVGAIPHWFPEVVWFQIGLSFQWLSEEVGSSIKSISSGVRVYPMICDLNETNLNPLFQPTYHSLLTGYSLLTWKYPSCLHAAPICLTTTDLSKTSEPCNRDRSITGTRCDQPDGWVNTAKKTFAMAWCLSCLSVWFSDLTHMISLNVLWSAHK